MECNVSRKKSIISIFKNSFILSFFFLCSTGFADNKTIQSAASAPQVLLKKDSSQKMTNDRDFNMGVSLKYSVGSATFVRSKSTSLLVPAKDRMNPLFNQNLSFSPSYKLHEKFSVAASWGFGYEYTTPNNPTGRRFEPGDLGLSLLSPVLFEEPFSRIALSAGVDFSYPFSYASRFNGTYFGSSASIGLSRLIKRWGLSFSYGFGIGKDFYKNKAHLITEEDLANIEDSINRAILCRSGEEFCDTNGMLAKYSFSNSFSVGYSPIEALSIRVSLSLSNSFSYELPLDGYSSDIVDSNGNRVVESVGRSDSLGGTISLGYMISQYLSLSLGMTNGGTAKTSDNSSFRNPFYDTSGENFQGLAANRTKWFFGINANY